MLIMYHTTDSSTGKLFTGEAGSWAAPPHQHRPPHPARPGSACTAVVSHWDDDLQILFKGATAPKTRPIVMPHLGGEWLRMQCVAVNLSRSGWRGWSCLIFLYTAKFSSLIHFTREALWWWSSGPVELKAKITVTFLKLKTRVMARSPSDWN